MSDTAAAELPPLETQDMFRLLKEVDLGIGPDKSTLPDTEAVRTWRATLRKSVAAQKAKGIAVDVPFEWE